MVEKPVKIVWTKQAEQHMKQVYEFVSKDSVKNAGKVMNEILKAVAKAGSNPEIYRADKYKENNDGSYRAFEKNRYRVTYRFTKNTIRILRVRHTKMKPLHY